MNCREFQNQLHEYVEVPANTLAAAEQHLTSCDACRQAVEKEKRLARALAVRFQQSTESLTLRPEIRRNILSASRRPEASPSIAESVVAGWLRWLRLAAIPASLLLIAALLLAFHFSGTRGHEKAQSPVTNSLVATTALPKQSPPTAASVEISYHLPAYTFGQQGDRIVDALSSETVVATGIFQPGTGPSLSTRFEMKTPL
jgi:anti-sigma factor RsiW